MSAEMPYARGTGPRDLHEAATASRDAGPFFCLYCGERVKLRRGPKRVAHFSHFGNRGCCTGEGVIHHAAKLKLADALERRERAFTLSVPCCWPGCEVTQSLDFDQFLAGYTHVVTEYSHTTSDGSLIRTDVETLLHGVPQVSIEIYHHHAVPPEKARHLSQWVEVLAEPLLADPYSLVMVKKDVPVNALIEAFRFDPALATQVDPQAVHRYRAQGSGQWVEEWHDDVYVNDFRYYPCFQHTQEHDRLMELAYRAWAAHRSDGPDPRPEPPSETGTPQDPSPFDHALAKVAQVTGFAGRFYIDHGVPSDALNGLSLRACRCLECQKPTVVVMTTFVQHYGRFQGLLRLFQPRAGEHVCVNYCGACGAVINRRSAQAAPGVMLTGDLVAAWIQALHAGYIAGSGTTRTDGQR